LSSDIDIIESSGERKFFLETIKWQREHLLRSLLGLRSFELHGAELGSLCHNGIDDMTVAL